MVCLKKLKSFCLNQLYALLPERFGIIHENFSFNMKAPFKLVTSHYLYLQCRSIYFIAIKLLGVIKCMLWQMRFSHFVAWISVRFCAERRLLQAQIFVVIDFVKS